VATFNPIDLIGAMKLDTLRVHAPSSIVFLCGGAIDATLDSPAVLRDAFYRIATNEGVPYKIILAEAAKPLTDDAGYSDLLSFESDIARVVGLILLFAESAGSLAELGAFAALDAVAPSLLAVLDDYYYDQESFIVQGPVRYLEKHHGDEAIHVLDRQEIGIGEDGNLLGLVEANFIASMFPVVKRRLKARPKWTKFDPENSGHAILTIVGLCKEFGALTQREIRAHLITFGIAQPRFENWVYCAQLLGWLKKIRNGNHIFFVATEGESALDYGFGDEALFKEKIRWRSDIREYWKVNDRARFNAISKVALGDARV
jgi:hypothetical protein